MEKFKVLKLFPLIAIVVFVGCAWPKHTTSSAPGTNDSSGTEKAPSGAGTGTGGTDTSSSGTGNATSGAGTGTGATQK